MENVERSRGSLIIPLSLDDAPPVVDSDVWSSVGSFG
jgi:hypothetical protein